MSDWYVGQAIVCVCDRSVVWCPYFGEMLPFAGQIYHIRSIIAVGESIGLRLAEIINRPNEYTTGVCEAAFDSKYFRPLVSQNTDISVFTRLLDTLPSSVPEDA